MATPIIANVVLGTVADDMLTGLNGNDAISGHDGNDNINGGGGQDLLLGNQGDDYIDGGTGRDKLYGGQGSDVLVGGAGADWLSGDDQSDTLRGGSGADTFYFNAKTAGTGVDLIIDFSTIEADKILLGKYGPSAAAYFVQDGANVQIGVDVDGDSVVDYGLATVLNANLADVIAATSFEILPS